MAKPPAHASAPTPAPALPGANALSDIARACGLSISTVSRGLRGHAKVSPATRLLIEETARRLDYRPNPYVAALMSNVRRDRHAPRAVAALAWVDAEPDPTLWRTDAVQRQFYEGAFARARQLGHHIERFHGGNPAVSPARLTSILHARGISGVICTGHRHNAHRTAVPVQRDRFALVTVGFRRSEGDTSFSINDQFETARLATLRAHEFGYRRIGFLTKAELEEAVEDRFVGGYLAALQRLRALPGVPVFHYDEHEDQPHAFADWLRCSRPDAVISTVQMSTVFRQHPSAHPWPADVGVAVLDWQRDEPHFAGVDQDHARVGAAAVDLLVAKLNRNEIGPETAPSGILDEGVWHDGPSLPRRA